MFWSQSVVLSDPPQLSLKYKLSNTDPSPSTFATTLQLPTSNTPLTSDPTMPLVPKAAYLMWTMTVSTMLTRWWGPWRKHQRQTSHHPCPHVRDKWRKTRDLILYPSLRGFIRFDWSFWLFLVFLVNELNLWVIERVLFLVNPPQIPFLFILLLSTHPPIYKYVHIYIFTLTTHATNGMRADTALRCRFATSCDSTRFPCIQLILIKVQVITIIYITTSFP